MNWELPDVQDGFRKGRTRDQIVNIHWIMEKAREFQKNIYFWFITKQKPLTVCITTNWKFFQEMGVPDHLTCVLRNLYAGLEATVRTGCELVPNWERSMSGCILSLYLFNLYAEWIMWNARLDDSQAGIKIDRKNINNLRYADNTTVLAESEEELKSLLMKVERGEWKSWLKTQHSEN